MIHFTLIVICSWVIALALLSLSIRRFSRSIKQLDQLYSVKTGKDLSETYDGVTLARNYPLSKLFGDEELDVIWNEWKSNVKFLVWAAIIFIASTIVALVILLIKGFQCFL